MEYRMGIKVFQNAQPQIRGVLFDMDGLVLDTEKLYTRFWMEACQFYDFPMNREQALRMRAANSKLSQANLHEFFGPTADYTTIRAKRIELMDAYIAEYGIETKPGIYELLDYLDGRGIPAAITSSSPVDRIKEHLGSLGLYTRFAKICSGYDVPWGKPAPDIYLKGARVLGFPPENCLALEDAPLGIESAFRAGCLPVMIPDQDEPDEQVKRMLFARGDTLRDVIDLMERYR